MKESTVCMLAALGLLGPMACAKSDVPNAAKSQWPFSIVRCYGTGDENAQFLETLFAAQERHPGLVEEIWFAGGGTGSASNAYEQAIVPNIGWRDRCRSHGIAFSYQQGNTLGHDAGGRNDKFLDDAWAVNEKGRPWPGIFCVNSPAALESNRRFMELVLNELQPDSYWPDDDMRLSKARWLGGYICMCERCIALFNKETGGNWTRETLARMLRDTANDTPEGARVRDAWSQFNARSLGRLAAVYRETADRVRPSCRLGLQVCDIRAQYQETEPRIFLEALSGNGRAEVGVRPGGGYWDERNHEKFVQKAVVETMMEATRCRSYGFVKQCCYEAENWPHIAALKTPGSMMLECATVLAAGCDSLALYWGSDKNAEPRESYDFFFETYAAWKPYLLAVRDMCANTRPAGVSEFIGENTRLPNGWGWRNVHQCVRLAENAVPLSVKYGEIEAYWMDGERAATLSRGDLPQVFSKPVLMTANAFPVLTKAFPDVAFLKKVEVRDCEGHEVFAGGAKATNVSAAFVPKSPDVKPLSGLADGVAGACGSCAIPTEFGGTAIGIQGIDMSKNLAGCQLWTAARRKTILDALDSAVPGGMRARLLTGGHSVEVIVRAAADGKTAGVFLLNPSMGPTRPLKLAIRNGKSSAWRVANEKGDVPVAASRTGEDEVVLDLPPMPAASSYLIVPDCRKTVVELPGEKTMGLALPPAPFPDRMSAYVWRNWGLVDKARLADAVGATAEDLTAIAEQMGLEPNPAVLPEWRRKGYITIVRRNWHLLPYDQLLKVLDMTREELRFSLMEDDFLWVKLGRMKPKCEALRWSAGMREEGRAERERLAAILKEEGLDPKDSEEPRFAFVKDIAAVDPGFRLPEKDDSPFDFRMIFSYFADYGDPLADPEIGSFPEGLLQKLSAQGVNAVWLHTVLRTLAKDPQYPEFGEGCENRIANLRKLVARCGQYGIRVFLYLNEPRAMGPDFFEANDERRAFKGAAEPEDGLFAMCTSHPEVRRWLRDSLAQVFSQVPGLGGIFTITMSENLTNCAARGHRERCPRCRERKVGDIVAEVNAAMIEGMAKGSPSAEAILYSWAWPDADEATIIGRLPKGRCRVLSVSERAMPIRRGGVDEVERDYSISIVGPGEYAKRVWRTAAANGIPTMAKVQAANSWELSSFPYLPVMDLVARHAVNLAAENVSGVMLSWSLGCCPSDNLGVYRDLRRGETTVDGVLDRMAERAYGKANVPRVRRAWTAFSDGFANYPFSCQTIYRGPQQWGPANPLYARKTNCKATMVGYPYDDLDGWRCKYPPETYVELIGRVADGFAEGCRLMEGVAGRRELDMFRAEQMHFAACRDQAKFVLARDRGDSEEMRRLAKAELDRAKAYWPIVRADSRIGYESSNHYFFVPRDVLEKVLSCHLVLGDLR